MGELKVPIICNLSVGACPSNRKISLRLSFPHRWESRISNIFETLDSRQRGNDNCGAVKTNDSDRLVRGYLIAYFSPGIINLQDQNIHLITYDLLRLSCTELKYRIVY